MLGYQSSRNPASKLHSQMMEVPLGYRQRLVILSRFRHTVHNFNGRAWLNGTNTETPVLDFVSIEYTSSYYSSGYFYCRFGTYNTNSMPVAATINYNATVPSGSNLKVEIRQGSTSSTSSNILSFGSGQTRSITLIPVTCISTLRSQEEPVLLQRRYCISEPHLCTRRTN